MKKTFWVILIIALTVCCLAYGSNDNLIRNPGSELGDTSPENWNSGSNAVWENEGHTGIHSLGLNPSGANGEWRCDSFEVVGNGNYTFGVWVKGTIYADSFRFKIRWFENADGSGFITENYLNIKSNLTEWIEVNATVRAPGNALSADAIFESVNGNGHVLTDDYYMVSIDVADPGPGIVSQWFTEFFYGTGKWLTLIIMLAIIIVIVAWNAYGGILFIPITIFLSIDYFRHISASSDFIWGAIMMMASSIYILAMLARKVLKQ